MAAELSFACFYDRCEECHDGWCEDHCHRDQEFDIAAREWVLAEEDVDVDA